MQLAHLCFVQALRAMLPPGKPDLHAAIVDEAKFEPSDIALVSPALSRWKLVLTCTVSSLEMAKMLGKTTSLTRPKIHNVVTNSLFPDRSLPRELAYSLCSSLACPVLSSRLTRFCCITKFLRDSLKDFPPPASFLW